MSSLALEAHGLGKRYQIGRNAHATVAAGYGSLRDALANRWRRPPAAVAPDIDDDDGADESVLWALKDVDLDIRRGEVVGIVGANGAGKSTLLKILARITEPTEGWAKIHGRVGSLLEVGTGFHPELTGRENIYLNASILGMHRSDVGRRFDEIVAFSGVERFLDTPVKRYSSGMYVRLAFAVAAHVEPEVLLVDEVLAVGDAAFQEKCLGKMSEVADSGRTVLFVSHNMAAVRGLCSRAFLLSQGRVQLRGATEDVVAAYLGQNVARSGDGEVSLMDRPDRHGSGRVQLVSFEARPSQGETGPLRTGEDAEFVLTYAARDDAPIDSLRAEIRVTDAYGINLFRCSTRLTRLREFRNAPPSGRLVCRAEDVLLVPGRYVVSLALKDTGGALDRITRAAEFTVIDSGAAGAAVPRRHWGSVIVRHEWDWQPLDVEAPPSASDRVLAGA